MKAKFKKILKKLWANRPFRTFMQGFLVIFSGATLLDLTDLNILINLLLSGSMAGLSALMSLNTGE